MIPSVIGTNLTIDDAPLVDGLPMIGGGKRKKSVGKKKKESCKESFRRYHQLHGDWRGLNRVRMMD